MLIKLIICFLLLIVIPVCIFFGSLFFFKLRTKYFVKNGLRSVAKIISINKTPFGQGRFANVEMVLEIENSTSQITIKQVYETIKVPVVGVFCFFLFVLFFLFFVFLLSDQNIIER